MKEKARERRIENIKGVRECDGVGLKRKRRESVSSNRKKQGSARLKRKRRGSVTLKEKAREFLIEREKTRERDRKGKGKKVSE